MSDSGLLQSFNINELAGASGLILSGVAGLLVVIFKSRCYCKFRVGFNDNCSICMCERKPPPDNIESEEEKNQEKKPIKKPVDITIKELEPEPEPESLVPSKKNIDNLV